MALRAAALAAWLALAPAPLGCGVDPACVEGSPGCIAPGCFDGVANGDESDVDCGGSCAACPEHLACQSASDCGSSSCVQGVCCAAPCPLWADSFGSLVDDHASDLGVAGDGSVVVAGLFAGAVDFGGGPLVSLGARDVFVVKLDAAGEHQWSRRFGGPADERRVRLAVAPDATSVLAIGSASTELDLGLGALASAGTRQVYLLALDARGEPDWSRVIASDTEVHVADIARWDDGDLGLVGHFYDATFDDGTALSTAGGWDILAARLDPTGAHRWSRRFGGVWHDESAGVAALPNGDLAMAVGYSRSLSFGGAALPFTGGVLSLGVGVLDPTGEHVWSRGFGSHPGPTGSWPQSIESDRHGALFITGSHSAPVDLGRGVLPVGLVSSAFALALEPHGTTRWSRSFGDHTAEARAACPDGEGGLLLAGFLLGDADFGGGHELLAGLDQVFVARLDASGGARWARNLGGVARRWPLACAFASSDRWLVAGGMEQELLPDGPPGVGRLSSEGGADAFVTVFAP